MKHVLAKLPKYIAHEFRTHARRQNWEPQTPHRHRTALAGAFARDVIRPLVVTRGADQTVLSSKFDTRSEPATIRNYGKLLLECAQTVPDGVVAFFTSYSYMQEIVREWHGMGLLKQVNGPSITADAQPGH